MISWPRASRVSLVSSRGGVPGTVTPRAVEDLAGDFDSGFGGHEAAIETGLQEHLEHGEEASRPDRARCRSSRANCGRR